ncbi:MAG: sigma factor-like helix-turn-helix DNA-binding protein, partial [Ktedonobacterales bacterium]
MAWQDAFSPAVPGLDPEQERESRLIAQARSGADWALSALIARYQPPVIRYLTRLTGNPAQARSMTEDIFLRMERRLHGPQGGHQLRLWLLRACTDSGLESLRHPRRKSPARLAAPSRQTMLLTERTGAPPVRRFMAGLGRLAEATSSTRRQVRQLIWTESDADENGAQRHPGTHGTTGTHGATGTTGRAELDPLDDELDALDPREALRHRLVRAVLAELPYGDAQCLALHLVAGLNQAEVAQALGITPSAARTHVVIGLQMFASRYEAALANLGVPRELGYHLTSPEVTAPAEEPAPLPRPTTPAAASAANTASYRVTPPIVPLHTLHTQHAEAQAVAAARQERLDQALAEGDDDDATLAEIAALHSTPTEAVAAEPRADMVMRLAENAIIGPVVDALPLSPDVSLPGRPTLPPIVEPSMMRGPVSRQLSYDLASTEEAPEATGQMAAVNLPRQGESGETLHPADRSYAGVPLHFDLPSISSQRLTAGPAPASRPLPGSSLAFEALTEAPHEAHDGAYGRYETSPTGETTVDA